MAANLNFLFLILTTLTFPTPALPKSCNSSLLHHGFS